MYNKSAGEIEGAPENAFIVDTSEGLRTSAVFFPEIFLQKMLWTEMFL
jgi:hypothetical protein